MADCAGVYVTGGGPDDLIQSLFFFFSSFMSSLDETQSVNFTGTPRCLSSTSHSF